MQRPAQRYTAVWLQPIQMPERHVAYPMRAARQYRIAGDALSRH